MQPANFRWLLTFFVPIDNNGNIVVKYWYDAWGNHTVSGSNVTLANLNPFRYRGYYYDTETGLYFLQTRYYDPEVGRFLNRDTVTYADPETIGGIDLYAYCLNNPVMYSDPTGQSIIIAIILGLGFIAGGVVGGKLAYDNAINDGKTGTDLFWSTIGGIIVGGFFGFAVAGASVALISVGAGAFGLKTIFGGVPILRAFALGAAAFDLTAFIVALIVGVSMEGIEYESKPITVPLPQETPTHPFLKKYNGRNHKSFYTNYYMSNIFHNLI